MTVLQTPSPFEIARVNRPFDPGYRPEWDVPSIGAEFTDSLHAMLKAMAGATAPDPAQKIPVVVAPPGYGKTHLFARVAQVLRDEVLHIFVPQVEDPRAPMDHIRWHVVESLFQAGDRGRRSPLERVLSRRARSSFLSYLSVLPDSLRARHVDLEKRLEADPEHGAELARDIKELDPFLAFAESVVERHPEHDAAVVRALALGWSPVGTAARRWLRGESLPAEQQDRLRLREEPPSARAVVAAVSALLQGSAPIVLCCDQAEALLVDLSLDGPKHLANALMDLLQNVPNLAVMISCLRSDWDRFQESTFQAFSDRCAVFPLRELTPEQGVALVEKRLRSSDEGAGLLERIDLDAVRGLVRANPIGPRQLIEQCNKRLGDWLREPGERGAADRDTPSPAEPWPSGPAVEPLEPSPSDLGAALVSAWNQRLDTLRDDPDRRATEVPEARLVRGIEALIEVSAASATNAAARCEELVLPGSSRRPRYRRRIHWSEGSVLVAITRGDNGHTFRYDLEDIQKLEQADEPVVIVHATGAPKAGAKAKEELDARRSRHLLRTVSLEEDRESFLSLEALLDLLDRATSSELELGGQSISRSRCLELIAEAELLDDLPLLRSLREGWPGRDATAAAPASASTPPPAPEATTPTPAPPTAGPTPPPPPPPVPRSAPPSIEEASPAAASPNAAATDWADERLAEVCQKLRIWNLQVSPLRAERGPSFARLHVEPRGTTTINRIRNKREDLKIHLGLQRAPLIEAQPGSISLDIELPERRAVSLQEAEQAPGDRADGTAFVVGLDVGGHAHWLELSDSACCHLLVGGTTGSGKSEFLRAMIAGLVGRHSPQQLQLQLIDPKRVTFNFLGGRSPYVPDGIAYEVDEALERMDSTFEEMERRYRLLASSGLQDISQLPEAERPPRIVVVFDEFADLMVEKDSRKALEGLLKRIGAKARAAGIHLVLATQRPEAQVVTPLLRSNLPGRICLRVASEADSKIVLNEPEGALLLGKGDLLWSRSGGLTRLQSPLVSENEFLAGLGVQR